MANGLNQSGHHDSFSMGKESNNGGTASGVVDQLSSQEHHHPTDAQSISQALNKVIPGGYRTKLSFRTPLQRGSNNSNFINYQNSIASESVERQRIRNLGLSSNATKPYSTADRSFSIQPQYNRMHKRLDELSQGSSQERINNIYLTLQENADDASAGGLAQERTESTHGTRNFRIAGSRESANRTNVSRVLKSRQRGDEQADFQTRNSRSPINQKRGQSIVEGGGSVERSGQVRVPGILMDSINSQQLRSKSTFRGNGGAGYGPNKLTSLQTMAYTSDQQYSSAAGGIMGMNSMQSYNGARDKVNIDRCALLEEIEKVKIEEIKQKTLKNLDKYSKKEAIFNVANLNKFANAPTAKYVPMMNSTLNSQGGGGSQSRANNPFSAASSKAGSRSNMKSRGNGAPGGSTIMDSQVSTLSKNSRDKSPNQGLLLMDKLNEQLRDRNISPQKGKGLNFMLTKSPILVQQQQFDDNGSGQANQMTQQTPQLQTKDELLQTIQISGRSSNAQGSTTDRKFSRNTINLAKLSLALKNKSSLESQQNAAAEGSGSGSYSQMAEKMIRFQQDEINSIASILNETLSKLKKPNTHFLQPLAPVKSAGKAATVPQQPLSNTTEVGSGIRLTDGSRRNSRLNLLSIVGGIRQSVVQQQREPDSAISLKKQDSVSQSIKVAEDANSVGNADDKGGIAEEEVDLDDLTQEDKFYLIQQIEAVQKNIRYYSAKQETYIFQDFDESTGQPTAVPSTTATKTARQQQPEQQSRYDSVEQTSPVHDFSFTEASAIGKTQQQVAGGGATVMSGRDSPKVLKKEKFGSRNFSMVGKKTTSGSPLSRETQQQVTRNNINNNNAVNSFVTSALGLLAQESLEIIEDADEVEEDELDNINIGVVTGAEEQQSPCISPHQHQAATLDDFSPLRAQQSEEPLSPGQGPFKHPSRKLRRNLNEGQQQILSKGDLKRYKRNDDGDEQQLGEVSEEVEDGPEEVSVLLHRGSRVVRDFDVLRFSKASSMDQNFLVDADNDSRLGNYANIGTGSAMKNRDGGRLDNSGERPMVEQRSPMAIKRKKSSQYGAVGAGAGINSTLRKLTNSLFEESAFGEKHNVIKEEEKERDEQD